MYLHFYEYLFLLVNRLNYLDRRVTAGMPSSRGEDWQPLLMYRNSLVHGETDQPLVTSKRAYYRKKKEPGEIRFTGYGGSILHYCIKISFSL